MKKKKTLAGLYKEKSIIGALAKLRSAPVFEDLSQVSIDSEQEFTISEIRYRVDQNGSIIPVFSLEELKQTPNLRFRADQLWITDICNDPEPEYKIWIGIGNISELSRSGLSEYPVSRLGKIGIDYKLGESVVILIPSDSLLSAKKENGFGEKVNFDETYSDLIDGFTGSTKIGYNGEIMTIEGKKYKVYGQLFLNKGTCYLYIE